MQFDIQFVEVSKIIDNLNIKKACHNSDIPTKITKLNKDITAPFISENFNSCIKKGELCNDLKHADVAPVHRKISKTKETNNRPVIMYSNFSKLCEKLMCKQLYLHFETILSSSKCWFRKRYSAQHYLSVVIEKFKEGADNGNKFSALLTDLLKAFDCIDNVIYIACLIDFFMF